MVYPGSRIGDGMFDSVSALKKQDTIHLSSSPCFDTWSEDYKYILELCRNKKTMPEISLQDSNKILSRIKPGVHDYWSVTPKHFINAGAQGLAHFNFLMNRVIMDMNSSSIRELNTVYALLLHKGHKKPRTSDRSYRTISTCPVIAKALDMYIHALYQDVWNSAQADTQYQGVGRNHELAALLITETVQHSLFHHHLPVFLLFLDARSAFDRVVISFLIRNFYLNGIDGNSLEYLNNRLSNRVTVIEWDKELLGPINDEQGLEQGGCISSDGYKMYNNDLLKLLQESHQGVQLGDGLVVSVVGQADDVALISNSIFNLYNLLILTINYCKKLNIELCHNKTKLLMIKRSCDQSFVALNPIRIINKQINFLEQAEHVGVIRSTTGNLPNLMNRLACHKVALAANLFTGFARLPGVIRATLQLLSRLRISMQASCSFWSLISGTYKGRGFDN